MRWWAAIAASSLVTACGPREVEPLVDLEAFTIVSHEASDPFRDEAPSDPSCDLATTGYELFGGEPSFGVDTMRCGYVTAATEALTYVETGDQIHLRLWHFDLIAPEAATATVAIAIGGRTLYERFLEIPGPSGLDAPYFEAPFDGKAGDPVHFHVRNHGSNSYALIELTVGGGQ